MVTQISALIDSSAVGEGEGRVLVFNPRQTDRQGNLHVHIKHTLMQENYVSCRV